MFEQHLRCLRLDLDTNFDIQTVRTAYIRMVRRYPPEHFPEKFAEIQSAWQALSLSKDFLRQMEEVASSLRSPEELFAFLWPLPPFRMQTFPDFSGVLQKSVRKNALHLQLDAVAEQGISWRTA